MQEVSDGHSSCLEANLAYSPLLAGEGLRGDGSYGCFFNEFSFFVSYPIVVFFLFDSNRDNSNSMRLLL